MVTQWPNVRQSRGQTLSLCQLSKNSKWKWHLFTLGNGQLICCISATQVINFCSYAARCIHGPCIISSVSPTVHTQAHTIILHCGILFWPYHTSDQDYHPFLSFYHSPVCHATTSVASVDIGSFHLKCPIIPIIHTTKVYSIAKFQCQKFILWIYTHSSCFASPIGYSSYKLLQLWILWCHNF